MKLRLKDLGCTILTVAFVSIPIWVISVAWRGPLFAVGALIVLLLLVFGSAMISKLFSRGDSQ